MILTAVMLQSPSVIDSKICKIDLLHWNKSESKTSLMNRDRFSAPFFTGGIRVQMISSNDSIARKSIMELENHVFQSMQNKIKNLPRICESVTPRRLL